jgi:hypothetical protein
VKPDGLLAAALAGGSLSLLLGTPPTWADATTTAPRQATVEQRSQTVMPFDMNRTMHVFTPTDNGGVQSVISHDGDPQQIALIRSHLRNEAKAFAHGDFADPASIHGVDMPGLAQLRAGASRIAVGYVNTANGASITYKTADPKLIAAIHDWFAAQVRDHGAHAMMMDH